jgi:DNA replication protein DnaC
MKQILQKPNSMPLGSQQQPIRKFQAEKRKKLRLEFGRKFADELEVTKCALFSSGDKKFTVFEIVEQICENQKGCVFFGPVRFGKSFAMATICELFDWPQYSYFTANELFEALLYFERTSIKQADLDDEQSRKYNDTIYRLKFGVIVIDDLNSSLNSLEVKLLANYIDSKHRRKRGILVSTNMMPEQWEAQKETSVDWARLLLRIEEMTVRYTIVEKWGTTRRQPVLETKR